MNEAMNSNMTTTIKIRQFRTYALWLLLYTLLVILWGAWVRISHSGDGCGDHWPLCNGEFIPGTTTFVPAKKTWVEYTHRLMSGSFGLIVTWFFWRSRKIFSANHPARKAAMASFIFMITEALLGAKLVLFGLVMKNDSPLRTFAMSLHMLNSLLLVASIALLWESAKPTTWSRRDTSTWLLLQTKASQWIGQHLKKILIGIGALFMLLAVSGAIAALASTLFPSESLLDGLLQDLNADSHYLIRLRILHPLMGVLVGSGLGITGWLIAQLAESSKALAPLKKAGERLALICFLAVPFGMLTLLSLAPPWMKIVHLLIAHSVWICLVLLIKTLLTEDSVQDLAAGNQA